VRLATKVFLANLLSIIALGVVAAYSLLAINRLVEFNRTVADGSAEAMKLEASVLESLQMMERYHKAYEALGWELAYVNLFDSRAEKVMADLDSLEQTLIDQEEKRLRVEAVVELAEYRSMLGLPTVDVAYEEVRGVLERLSSRTSELVEAVATDSVDLEQRTWDTVVIALALGLLAALTSAGFLAVRITRDLGRLSTAAAQVADGVFTGELPIRRRDEVGELAQAFQRMAEQLQEIDRSKEEFFAQVSHEFRTPLTAMREATSLLRDRVAGPIVDKQDRLLEIIGSSCERLLRLVNQILELSRVRAHLQTIERRQVQLSAVMENALQELRPQAEARRLDLRASSDGAVAVEGDEEQLTEVFVNLVGNAIKYTPIGGRVQVRLARRDDGVEIEVGDNGPGIPENDLPHVFDRFWQAKGVEGGSGLGLAIVKSIVEAHGGKVWAGSEPGEGTRFTVRLPEALRPA
jgi:two-component system, NtrC family, sensor histidine kinase GlrK